MKHTVYLDNAATSYPKPREVIKALDKCVRDYCGNPGRSSHYFSVRTAEELYRVREDVSSFFRSGAPENVIFTENATYSLNTAIKTMVPPGCEVIISDVEHNSVVRPLERLRREHGITYKCFSTDGDISENIEKLIGKQTRCIISTLQSNVTGDAIPLGVLSAVKRRYGLVLIIDASQAAGHRRIDLSKACYDAFCAPGHKGLLGIQGSGILILSDGNRCRESFVEGGSGSESYSKSMPAYLPDRYEAGTLPAPSIVSLGAGIRYINGRGIAEIENHLSALTEAAKERLAEINGVTVYTRSAGGILAFNVRDFPSSDVSGRLDRKGICTRGGLHCSPSVHEKLGTIERGCVRASFSCMNTMYDIEKLVKEIRLISEYSI